MGQQTTPIREQNVFAQDTAPQGARDGVLWIDTSKAPRETYVYSTDSGRFEAIARSPVRLNEQFYEEDADLGDASVSDAGGVSDTQTFDIRPQYATTKFRVEVSSGGGFSSNHSATVYDTDGNVLYDGGGGDATFTKSKDEVVDYIEVSVSTASNDYNSAYTSFDGAFSMLQDRLFEPPEL